MKQVRWLIEKIKIVIVRHILGLKDTPHQIALGLAVGVFFTWLPLIGFQMGLIVFFATVLRANKVVGLPVAWITNPATLWVYLPNYYVGALLLKKEIDPSRFLKILQDVFSLTVPFWEKIHALSQTLKDVLAALWLGSLIIALLLAIIFYYLTYYAIVKYREITAAKKAAD